MGWVSLRGRRSRPAQRAPPCGHDDREKQDAADHRDQSAGAHEHEADALPRAARRLLGAVQLAAHAVRAGEREAAGEDQHAEAVERRLPGGGARGPSTRNRHTEDRQQHERHRHEGHRDAAQRRVIVRRHHRVGPADGGAEHEPEQRERGADQEGRHARIAQRMRRDTSGARRTDQRGQGQHQKHAGDREHAPAHQAGESEEIGDAIAARQREQRRHAPRQHQRQEQRARGRRRDRGRSDDRREQDDPHGDHADHRHQLQDVSEAPHQAIESHAGGLVRRQPQRGDDQCQRGKDQGQRHRPQPRPGGSRHLDRAGRSRGRGPQTPRREAGEHAAGEENLAGLKDRVVDGRDVVGEQRMTGRHDGADDDQRDPRGCQVHRLARHRTGAARRRRQQRDGGEKRVEPRDQRQVDVADEAALEELRIGDQPIERRHPADDDGEGEQAGEEEAGKGQVQPMARQPLIGGRESRAAHHRRLHNR